MFSAGTVLHRLRLLAAGVAPIPAGVAPPLPELWPARAVGGAPQALVPS